MAEAIISPGIYARENDISFINPAPVAAGAAFIGPTVKGPVEEPTIVTSYSDYLRTFGETITSGSKQYEYLTSVAVKGYFQQGGGTALVTRIVSRSADYTRAANTFISASAKGSTQPFTLETLGKGVIFNNATSSLAGLSGSTVGYLNSDGSLVSGSADNLRWEIGSINNALGTFSLTVRRGDDNTNNKTILETFNNLSLDPNSPNYIESVIGNQFVTVATDSTSGVSYNYKSGNYPNNSKYIRVSGVNLPTNYYIATDGVTVSADSAGVSYSGSLPIASSGSFWSATGNNVTTVQPVTWFQDITTAATNAQGVVGASYNTAISLLSNKDDYQFNIISTPGLIASNTTAGAQSTINSIIALAENRGDCIAVVDLVPTGSSVGATVTQATGFNSSYAATYWPWVQIKSATGRNEWAPAGTLVPGIYAFTDAIAAPWFAPAGLVRGGIPGVIQAERKITKGERDTLYAGKINPIATFPGSGIAVFGQKTLQTKASALDRVNVRRLLIALKKFIGDQARNLVFEQNTLTTRNKFLSVVNPYLQSVVERQGLYAFRVVMDDSNNTADSIDRNQLNGQILIQPTKTVEFVVLDFTIAPTGATFA
jgi:phage tail sheath protein FI